MDQREQNTLRRLAQSVVQDVQATSREGVLARGVLALDSALNQTRHAFDPMAQRLGAGGHKYPALVQAGHGHWWQGPGLNDWHPQLLRGITAHLRENDRPCTEMAARTYLRNRLMEFTRDPQGAGLLALGALEDAWEKGRGRSDPDPPRPAGTPPGRGGPLPPSLAEMSPEEQAANLAAMRKAMGAIGKRIGASGDD